MRTLITGVAVVFVALGAGCSMKKKALDRGKDWSIQADMAGACCCAVPCPCPFQQKPTLGHCEANVLFEVKTGHHKGVSLNGLQFIMSWRGGDWVKYYVSKKATDRQLGAIQAVMPEAVPMFKKTKNMGAERVAISVSKKDGKIIFYSPTARVEMKMLKGKDGGPVVLSNLNHPLTEMRVQYLASKLSNDDANNGFSHTDTNGMTSVLNKEFPE